MIHRKFLLPWLLPPGERWDENSVSKKQWRLHIWMILVPVKPHLAWNLGSKDWSSGTRSTCCYIDMSLTWAKVKMLFSLFVFCQILFLSAVYLGFTVICCFYCFIALAMMVSCLGVPYTGRKAEGKHVNRIFLRKHWGINLLPCKRTQAFWLLIKLIWVKINLIRLSRVLNYFPPFLSQNYIPHVLKHTANIWALRAVTVNILWTECLSLYFYYFMDCFIIFKIWCKPLWLNILNRLGIPI